MRMYHREEYLIFFLEAKRNNILLNAKSFIILDVIFNNHNRLIFLYLIEFRFLALHKLGETESTIVCLITFFTKHICQCSLKMSTKSSKDLFVKPLRSCLNDFPYMF